MNYTYIVKCSDGTFYTGWTNDLTRRMEAHNQEVYKGETTGHTHLL